MQEPRGGEVGEADALGGQRGGDVEASASLVVRRGVLPPDVIEESAQVGVVLGDLEVLVVADEPVGAERRKTRVDHAHAAQQHQRVAKLAVDPWLPGAQLPNTVSSVGEH